MKVLILFLIIFSLITVSNADVICNNGSDCLNNGVCNVQMNDDIINSYCSCPQNYHGSKCQFRQCQIDPCKNGGFCESLGPNSLQCHCSDAFVGDFCQSPRPTVCDLMNCGNGKCALVGGSFDHGICECNEGFTGERCTIVKACKINSCNLHGECVSDGASSFACECFKGFYGRNCEFQVDECASNSCYPGSKCINDIGKYECECRNGRVGKFCHFEDPCKASKKACNSRGQCFATFSGEHTCLCESGYTGQSCEQDIDECTAATAASASSDDGICGENGECMNTDGGYFCKCDTDYSGQHCSIKSEPIPSFSPSTILVAISVFICFCLLAAIIFVIFSFIRKLFKAKEYEVDHHQKQNSQKNQCLKNFFYVVIIIIVVVLLFIVCA